MIPRHCASYMYRERRERVKLWARDGIILKALDLDATRVERIDVEIEPTFLLIRANQRLNYSSPAVPLPSSKCHSYPCFSFRSNTSQINKSIIPSTVQFMINRIWYTHRCDMLVLYRIHEAYVQKKIRYLRYSFLVFIEILIRVTWWNNRSK